jgi:hypothetical protein
MNLDFNPSIVTNLVRGLMSELREKRLWPVAVVLLAALVAVPLLLTNSSSTTPVAQAPQATPPPPSGTAIPALDVQSTPAHSRLTSSARDPFTQQHAGNGSSTTATAASSAVTSASSAASSAVASLGTGGGSSSVPTSTASASLPSTPTSSGSGSVKPSVKTKAAPTGLAPTQSYDVSLAITNSTGGVNTISPLARLSVLPNASKPLLVELGVSQNGKRVLFVVQPGTIVGGQGKCTPGPIDCEILSLAPGQTESLSTQSPTGPAQVALFGVTRIKVANHSSVAAANKARRAASAAGRALLSRSTLSALSLFRYEPSLGAVADLRNLSVLSG